MSRNLRLVLTALSLAVLAPTARSAELTFDVERLPDLTAADLPSLSADKSGTAYASLLEGKDVVPPRATRAKALFLSRPSRDGSELSFGLWAVFLRNPVEANILLGRPGENGPSVATIYGPNAPGGGRVWGQLATGKLTADDLEGPFAGQSLYRLFAAIEAGEAYVQIATDDGEPGDNTGAGDFVDGEIRGDVVRLGRPFPMPMARLQVIHNAADPAAAVVDVWLNGAKALDDFAFRAATPFLDVPAETELAIGIAGPASDDPSDILVTIPVTLEKGARYVAFANGVLDPSAFAANPDGRDTGFGLLVKAMAREKAEDGGKVEFFVLHGATDAPTVDVIARGVGTLVDDAAYRDITDYLAVPADKYVLDVTPGADNGTVVASFAADLSGLEGGAAAVFASGFLDPSANRDGEAFGLFAALPDGKVVAFPVVVEEPATARLQVIHNAADPAAAVVDVWLNGAKALDDFAFRAATPFLDVPAETELAIGIAGPASDDPSDILVTIPVTLEKGARYVAFANGVLDPSAFAANPDGRDTGFGLLVKAMAREKAEDGGKVEFFVLHGATDAPTVDVIARGVGTLVKDAAYRDITDYLAVPAASYVLDVAVRDGDDEEDKGGDDERTVVASFVADLRGLEGGAAAVFASGFLDPSANRDGEAFGLFAALANGTVVELPAKSALLSWSAGDFESPVRGRDGAAPTAAPSVTAPLTFEVSQNLPNPVRGSTTVAFALPREANVLLTVHDVAGRRVGEVAPGMMPAGRHQLRFDASRLTSGVYWYRLQAGADVQSRKMVVTR